MASPDQVQYVLLYMSHTNSNSAQVVLQNLTFTWKKIKLKTLNMARSLQELNLNI